MSVPWTDERREKYRATMKKRGGNKWTRAQRAAFMATVARKKRAAGGEAVSPAERKIAKAAKAHHAMNGHGLIRVTLTLTSMKQVTAILAAAKTGRIELEFVK
jgi:hypothetical protein